MEKISYADVGQIQQRLDELSSDGAIDHLYDFGKVLVDEIQQRTTQINDKLIQLLSWTAGVLAVIFLGQTSWLNPNAPLHSLTLFLIATATSCGIGGVGFAFVGLRTKSGWTFPSETDWFRDDLISNPILLKKCHTIGLLEAHQQHNRLTAKKAASATHSEVLLAISAVLVGSVTLIQLSGQLH